MLLILINDPASRKVDNVLDSGNLVLQKYKKYISRLVGNHNWPVFLCAGSHTTWEVSQSLT